MNSDGFDFSRIRRGPTAKTRTERRIDTREVLALHEHRRRLSYSLYFGTAVYLSLGKAALLLLLLHVRDIRCRVLRDL